MKRSQSTSRERDRGAVAVEFALVLPMLLALIAGIVEFSYAYNLQISVTQAAREAARTMAIENDQDEAQLAATAGAPGLNAENFDFVFTPTDCDAAEEAAGEPANVSVTITYTAGTMTGLFGNQVTITGVGAMRCGG